MRSSIDLIKNLVFFVINIYRATIYLLSSCFKIKDDKVFVNCFDGKGFADNPKYIILELLKLNENIKVYWICYKENKDSDLQQINFIKPFSVKAIYHQATSKVWISTVRMPFYSIKRTSQIYVHTWHGGLGFKKVEQECENALSSRYIRTAKHDSKMIDYYISANNDNTQLYLNHFWYSSGKIIQCGAPRNDIFFNYTTETIHQIKAKYCLINKKVVLYAPTFRKSGSFERYDINYDSVLETLKSKKKEDWVIIIRLHPRLVKYSNNYISYNDNIINGSMIDDVQELMLITDLLITDYSSIALDFINLKRPTILYATDIDEYKKDRDFHIKLEDTPFPIATNNNELINILNTYNNNRFQSSVNNFKTRYGYSDNGKASLVVARLINKELQQ